MIFSHNPDKILITERLIPILHLLEIFYYWVEQSVGKQNILLPGIPANPLSTGSFVNSNQFYSSAVIGLLFRLNFSICPSH